MHAALQNEDVFLEIIGHISSQDYMAFPPQGALDKARLSTLFNVALTCRSFTEPALDELWRRIDNMSHLLRLLPSFQVFNNQTYHLDGPILDAHWNLLDKYAKRIQSVVYAEEFDIHPSVYLRLAMRNKPLLPSLRQFYTMICGPELMVMASPSLLRVYALPCTDDRAFHPGTWTFIDTLAQKSPNLHHIYLGLPITGRSLDSVFKMKNLRRLEICQAGNIAETPINSTFFAKLSSLKNLTFISLYGLADSRPAPETRLPYVGFPELREIMISDTLPRIIPLLQIGKFPMLRSLKLVFGVRFPQGEVLDPAAEEASWRSFFRLLEQRSGSILPVTELNLGYRAVQVRRSTIPDPIWPGITASTFQHLLKLNLTKFNTTYPLFDSLTNADIRMFADAWPNLEELRVETRIIGQITIEAFVIVAERFPRLREVGFSLQTGNLLDPERLPRISSHRLEGIDVFRSIITDDDLETFARCLVRLFPNLNQLTCGLDSPSPVQWEQIRALVTTLQKDSQSGETNV